MQRGKGQFAIASRRLAARIAAALAALLAIILPSLVLVGDAPRAPGESPLHGEFAIGRQGRMIHLPVTVGNREFFCLLDTGASRSAFDESLKPVLGRPRGTRILNTPAGNTRVEQFDWPEAKLRGQPLSADRPIVALNLSELRQATNDKIYGVIGMDVLRNCRLQIDFDAGWIRFLESLPRNPRELGERISLEFAEDGPPYFVGRVAQEQTERFLIDTGAQGNSLAAAVFDRLYGQKSIQLGRSFASMTIAGKLRGERGKLDRLTIGSFVHDGLRVSRINVNSVGLRYLSRFCVTFDFPGGCAYLQKGKHYARPEPSATSGLTILWLDGEPVVDGVKPDGPGERAGVKPRDVLVRVDQQPATEIDHFALRQILTSHGGRQVPLDVRRGTRELHLDVVLDED